MEWFIVQMLGECEKSAYWPVGCQQGADLVFRDTCFLHDAVVGTETDQKRVEEGEDNARKNGRRRIGGGQTCWANPLTFQRSRIGCLLPCRLNLEALCHATLKPEALIAGCRSASSLDILGSRLHCFTEVPGLNPCYRILVFIHQTATPIKQPALRVVLRMAVYYSKFNPISQSISVVFRTTRKDSNGRLMGEHEYPAVLC